MTMNALAQEAGNWIEIVALEDIPQLGSRVIKTDTVDIALFRTALDEVFAIKDACPHKQGPLSQGIVHGTSVTCPLHNWKIDLASGEALGPDEGCTNVYPVKVENGRVYLGSLEARAA
jgi:nitrite reductase (NADH) small subunit